MRHARLIGDSPHRRLSGIRMALLALALGAGLADRAAAQSSPWQPEQFNAGWIFTPGAVAGAFRDSNVSLLTTRQPSRSAGTLLLGPRAEIDFNGRRTRFGAGYAGALESRQSTRYEQHARMSAQRALTPRVSVRTGASYAMAPTTDTLGDDTLLFADVGVRRLHLSGGLGGALSRRTTLDATYAFQRTQFNYELGFVPEGAAFLGGHFHSPGVRLSHVLSARASASGSWTYTHGELSGLVQTFGLQQFEGGFSYRVARYTTVGGSGGVASLRLPALEITGWEPTFRGFLEQQIERSTIRLHYARGVVPEFTYGSLSTSDTVGASLTAPIVVGRVYLGGSTSLSRHEPIAGLVRGLHARTVRVSGAVGYRLTRWLSAEAFVNSARQTPFDSQAPTIRRTRIGFVFVTSKPMRID